MTGWLKIQCKLYILIQMLSDLNRVIMNTISMREADVIKVVGSPAPANYVWAMQK